jgi:hypothetical protein
MYEGSRFKVQGSGFRGHGSAPPLATERPVKSKEKLMNIERPTSNKVFYHFIKLAVQALVAKSAIKTGSESIIRKSAVFRSRIGCDWLV